MVNAGLRAADTLAQGATIDVVTITVAALFWAFTRTGAGNLMPGGVPQLVSDKARRETTYRYTRSVRGKEGMRAHLLGCLIVFQLQRRAPSSGDVLPC